MTCSRDRWCWDVPPRCCRNDQHRAERLHGRGDGAADPTSNFHLASREDAIACAYVDLQRSVALQHSVGSSDTGKDLDPVPIGETPYVVAGSTVGGEVEYRRGLARSGRILSRHAPERMTSVGERHRRGHPRLMFFGVQDRNALSGLVGGRHACMISHLESTFRMGQSPAWNVRGSTSASCLH